MTDNPLYVQALVDSAEVARVDLHENFEGSMHAGAPCLGRQALEIQFFEVAQSWRRQGIGVEVVSRLADLYPTRRLLALSEEADEFWSSLGWARFDYWDGPVQYRPLFVQPPRRV
jgi:GNAT superfamily N-acetyltransferase